MGPNPSDEVSLGVFSFPIDNVVCGLLTIFFPIFLQSLKYYTLIGFKETGWLIVSTSRGAFFETFLAL